MGWAGPGGLPYIYSRQTHILSAGSSSHELFHPPSRFTSSTLPHLPFLLPPTSCHLPPPSASSHPRCVVSRMQSSVGVSVCLLAVALVGLFPQPAGGQGRYLLCPTSHLRVLQAPRGHSGDPQPAHRASRAGVQQSFLIGIRKCFPQCTMAMTETVERGSAVEPTNCVSCGSFCVLEGHFKADLCVADISKHVIYTKLVHSCLFPLECAVFCFRIGCLLKNDPLPRFVLVCF